MAHIIVEYLTFIDCTHLHKPICTEKVAPELYKLRIVCKGGTRTDAEKGMGTVLG